MRAYSLKNIFAIAIPTLLAFGMVACFLIYRSNAAENNAVQTEIQVERIASQPGAEQSRVFLAALNSKADILDIYSKRLTNVGWTEYDTVLPEINDSARKYGFSYITVAGEDGIFYDENDEGFDLSENAQFLAALAGKNTLEKTEIGAYEGFAYAVPFETGDGSKGALIGLFSNEQMQGLLKASASDETMPSLIFSSSGDIVAQNGQIPGFDEQTNVFSILDSLTAENRISPEAIERLKKAVSGDDAQTVISLDFSDGYLTSEAIGMNDWQLMQFVSPAYIARQSNEDKDKALLSLRILYGLGVLLILSIVFFVLDHRHQGIREQKAQIEAYYFDKLTGLYNKTGFEIKASERLAKLPKDRVCAFVSFEVVSFRSYNALYGFDAGDELLCTIADIVGKFMREGDVACRLYADHFVWFIGGSSDEEIFETFRAAVRLAKDTQLPFFLCGGIYLVEDRTMPISTMVDKASIAKDAIKYKFNTGISIYNDTMLECQLEDAELLGNMMRGLQNGEFVDYYQPKYNINSEGVSGAEALVRWKKPDGEIIMPGRFIELFEKNGFIRKLDFYMFEKACILLKRAQDADMPFVPISVNFSRVHLYDQRFPQRLFNLAASYGVDPGLLEIELTESAFLLESEILRQVVDKLHEFGFSVAIDDFGSGFSSLNMLKDIEVDTLKIDMKFLEGFELGGRAGTVVTAVVRMAKWLGIPVVAEGVETIGQLEFLRTLGCEVAQGYYYSRPIPREAFERLLLGEGKVSRLPEKPTAVTIEGISALLGGDSLVTALVDGILGGFGLYELSDGRLEAIRVNRSYLDMLGYPDMAAFSEHSLNVLPQVFPADLDSFLEACHRAVETGGVQRFIARRYNYYGSLLQFKGFIKHVGGTENNPIICISFLDATERLRIEKEKELNKYNEALYGIFDDIYEFNYSTNTVRMLSSNRKPCMGQTHNLKEIERNWLENKIYSDDRAEIESKVAAIRSDKIQLPLTAEYRVIKEGEIRWMMSSLVAVSGGSYMICSLDVTEKKQFEMFVAKMENLHHRLELDVSTGVLNGATAELLIKDKLKKEETARDAALMIITLDNFREISVICGHLAGETYIKDAAARIKSLFREQDIIGRFDNDRFIVYMSGVNSVRDARAKAVRVQDYVSDIVLPDMRIVECSVGVGMVSIGEGAFINAYEKAKKALEQAQKSSFEKCVVFDD